MTAFLCLFTVLFSLYFFYPFQNRWPCPLLLISFLYLSAFTVKISWLHPPFISPPPLAVCFSFLLPISFLMHPLRIFLIHSLSLSSPSLLFPLFKQQGASFYSKLSDMYIILTWEGTLQSSEWNVSILHLCHHSCNRLSKAARTHTSRENITSRYRFHLTVAIFIFSDNKRQFWWKNHHVPYLFWD